jgi:hypothetical protein
MDLAPWHDFLLATAAAAGALAGLVFVALSINLSRILETPELPGRSAETIIQLAGPLLLSLVLLVPDAEPRRLGAFAVFGGAMVWLFPTSSQLRSILERTYYRRWFAFRRLIVHQVASVPLIVGGILIAVGAAAGMDWLALGFVACMAVALANAWVLLVEIVR